MASHHLLQLFQHVSVDTVVRFRFREFEIARARMEKSSAARGTPVKRHIIIYDLEGLGSVTMMQYLPQCHM